MRRSGETQNHQNISDCDGGIEMPWSGLFRETAAEDGESREIAAPEISLRSSETVLTRETSAQEISEDTFEKTIEHVTGEFGDIMPESQLVRIDIESENYKPTVLSPEAYSARFPEADPSVLGHYDAEGRIFLKEGNQETVNHVATHEAMHLTSFKELDDSNAHREVYRSGIREVVYNEYGVAENNNQALNEGITELYAVREMQRRGEMTSIEAVSAYPEAQQKAYELQGIVGSETIQKAYFGGDIESLKAEVSRLNYGDETAWERYSRNIDILEYGTDADEIQNARWALTIQNAWVSPCATPIP